MKNKQLAIIIPILILVFSVGIVLVKKSYSATVLPIASTEEVDNSKYRYIRRNMLSHHFITNNSDPSGTILLKSGDAKSVSGKRQIVYCAHKGKWIAKTSQGKYYKKVSIEKTSVKAIKNHKSNLIGLLTNSYPYIPLAELKERIKKGIGEEEYNAYLFDTLDVQEAMTATQASIWNAIAGNKNNSRYRTTKSVGTIKYLYFHNANDKPWGLNWNKTSTYNITSGCYKGTGSNHDCGSKSTYLAPGDTAESAGTYKKNNSTTLVKKRINRLIDWYYTLREDDVVVSDTEALPEFGVKSGSDVWTENGKVLTVTILANNDNFKYKTENEYQIVFYDLSGNQLTNVSRVEVKKGDLIIGYTYTIKDIPTKGVLANVQATIPSEASNVYVYQANASYSGTQYLIGVDSGSIPVEANLQILNDSTGKVYIYKTNSEKGNNAIQVYDSKQSDICGGSNPCFEGAEFVIYAADKETVLKEFETDTEPTELSLPLGTYYIQEVSAPAGYTYNTTMKEFKIEKDGQVVAIHYNDMPTRICIRKIESGNKNATLDGANITLQSVVGGVYEEFTSYSQEANEGIYCTEPSQLPVGYYYIVETRAPANYIKNNVYYRIKVGDVSVDDISEELDTDELGITVVDLDLVSYKNLENVAFIENKPGTVITKSDLATGGCVEDAKLTVKDANGKVVDEWTSSCEFGKDSHELELEPGKYTLVEETATDGYATAESIEFTIDENGRASTSLDMKDAPIEVCLQKVSGNNKNLAGAEFEIYDAKGKLYNRFTSSTSATCFQYMPVGKYTLKETKAPSGYKKAEKDVTIEVKDTAQTQTFEIPNEVEVPKTSLDYSEYILIISSIFMIFGLGVVGYYVYKKQQ